MRERRKEPREGSEIDPETSRRRSGWQKLSALGAEALGQPTRVEVDEAFREIQQLKREVRELKRAAARAGATGTRT